MSNQTDAVKMEQRVHQAILARNLLRQGDRIVVAVSGGPDSVALLACLVALSSRWKWDLIVGHVNHGLRGDESEGDADFVKKLGNDMGVSVSVRDIRLEKRDAKLSKQSFQAYAREARYHALERILWERNATKIALGHMADDQAETVLMWMLRGSGTGGLSGIPPKRGERIVRPLLDIPRIDIIAYLKQRQLPYRMDSSNTEPVYLRNRLRQDLLPHLKEYAPGIVHTLSRQAEIIRDDHEYLENMATEFFQDICVMKDEQQLELDTIALLALPLAIRRRVVRCGFQQLKGNTKDLRFDVVQRVLDCLDHGQSGWTMKIHDIDIALEYDRLVFSTTSVILQDNVNSLPLNVALPGDVVWPSTGQRMVISKHNPAEVASPSHKLEMHLDADTFTPELQLRSWIPGDRFCPKGFGGRKKKLQDFFSDVKLPRSQRAKVPLLVSPEGILWVGGMREDERFQVSNTTTSVVKATLTS